MTDSVYRLNSSASDVNFRLSCDSVLPKLIPAEKSLIDLILSHDNPDQAEILLPDGRKFVWYLAIGSMTNPISLYLRDLTPVISYPVTCRDHQVTFRCSTGIATIVECPGEEFDGVVHLLTDEQMACLDQIEVFYHRIEVKCMDYQGQSRTVKAYQMNLNDQPANLPNERYLDIIVKGCEYYQVRSEYINRLKNEQAVRPRKLPDTFHSFTDIPSDVYYSLEDLQKHNGNDLSLPLWISVNGKILEYTGLPPNDHPDYELHRNFLTFCQQKLAGREITPIMARTLYDPLYKLPENDDDICDEHRARMEDHYYNTYGGGTSKKNYWKPIGRLRQSDNRS